MTAGMMQQALLCSADMLLELMEQCQDVSDRFLAFLRLIQQKDRHPERSSLQLLVNCLMHSYLRRYMHDALDPSCIAVKSVEVL